MQIEVNDTLVSLTIVMGIIGFWVLQPSVTDPEQLAMINFIGIAFSIVGIANFLIFLIKNFAPSESLKA